MRRLASTLALAAALLTACGGTGTPVDPAPVNAVERPRPVGVAENPTPTTGSAAPAPPPCPADGRASLRPDPQIRPGSTMDRIRQRDRLIAGVDQNTFLFGFRNPSSNQLEGFDIDRVQDIAEAIFGDRTKVQYKVLSSAERIPALQNGEVDVVVRTFTANCERWQQINFSRIYYVAHQRVLVERSSQVKSLGDLAGKRVCAQRGSTSISRLAQHPSKPVPVATDTWSDCLVMLQQRQVEAVSTDDTILAGLAAQDPNVHMVGDPLSDEPYGIGIPQANQDMVRFVNAVLDQSVRDGDWSASYARWLGPAPEPPPAEYRD